MKRMAKVLLSNVNGKAIVQSGKDIFLIDAMGHYKNEEVFITESNSIKMPSFLHAIGFAFNQETEDAIKFIKENF